MGKNTRKLLVIIPSLESGGAELVLLNILRWLPGEYETELCVGMHHGRYFDQVPGRVKVTILFRNVFLARVLTFAYIKFNFRLLYRFMVRRKLRERYDVAVSFVDGSHTDLLFMLPKQTGMTISWIHASKASYSNYAKFYRGRYLARVIEQRYSRLDRLVFVSHDAMEEFISLFGRYPDMRVIYNVLDIERKREMADAFLPGGQEGIQMVAMGSLFPVKGYDMLVAACGMLKNDGLGFRLMIFGEGPLEAALRQQIGGMGLGRYVTLEGYHDNPFPYLKTSDLFVMTSVSEALPTALCEAILFGKPVVVTDCSGCREIVDHGRYGLMTGQSTVEIYNGLKAMITDPALREKYGKLARERAGIFDDRKALRQISEVLG
jgi:glycosyltransferase involved in cell wall biosynthesis